MMGPYVSDCLGKLRSVLLCKPVHFQLMPVNETALLYIHQGQQIDLETALNEHADFAAALESAGAQVVWVEPQPEMPYQVYTRDLGAVTPCGAVLGPFTFPMRHGEVEAAAPVISQAVPVWKRLPEAAGIVFEGGDFMYMDRRTVALGIGARTTRAGAEHVRRYLKEMDIEVIPVEFDPAYCHLDMIFNVVAERVAVACVQVLPDEFISRLRRDRWQIVRTTPEEVLGLLGNLLAVGKDCVVSPRSSHSINPRLRALGIEVIEVSLDELIKGGGGPHCMTFPLIRDPHSFSTEPQGASE